MVRKSDRQTTKAKRGAKPDAAVAATTRELIDLLFDTSVEETQPTSSNDNLIPCAAYGRYSALSANRSNMDSAVNQLAACRTMAPVYGLRVVEEFSDEDETGVAVLNRPGIRRLMAGVEQARFLGVMLPDISRMGRHAAHLIPMIERLYSLGVPIYALGHGKLSKEMAMSMAITAEAAVGYAKVATAMAKRARAEKGLMVGRPPFGYRMDPEAKGRLIKVEEEVETIRYAVDRLLAGATPNEVCRDLNRRGLLSRSGKIWTRSTLIGSQRQPGICRNSLIAGVMVYGRHTTSLSTLTGKTVETPAPRSKWIVVEVPDVAIIDIGTFLTLQDVLDRRSTPCAPRGPQRLLSRKLRCFACGANMISTGSAHRHTYVRCQVAHTGGSCNAHGTVDRELVQAAVLDRVRTLVQDGSFEKLAAAEYQRQVRARDELETLDLRKAEKRLADNERQKKALVDAITQGRIIARWGAERMEELDRQIGVDRVEVDRRRRGLARLQADELPIERVRLALSRIEEVLKPEGEGTDMSSEAFEAVRALIDSVRVTPDEDRYHLEVTGFLSFRTQIPKRGRGRPKAA